MNPQEKPEKKYVVKWKVPNEQWRFRRFEDIKEVEKFSGRKFTEGCDVKLERND